MFWGPFPSCFLWAHQSLTTVQMLHLMMWSADFWLGSVPHHFRSCRNTWQLMGSNLAPSLLVLPRLARHNSSLMVWQPYPTHPDCSWAHWETDRHSALEGLARQRCSQTEWEAAVSILLSLQQLFHHAHPWPRLNTKFKSRRKSLPLAFGLCFSSNLLQAWGISQMLNFLLDHEASCCFPCSSLIAEKP